jgi:hypothetical protein
MKFLEKYYAVPSDQKLVVNAQQGSAFAKQIACDFNPIHDADSKRFCVPGDLLFALALQQYGLHQKMAFRFQGLVKADADLSYPAYQAQTDVAHIEVTNDRHKPVLDIDYSGDYSREAAKIESLLVSYVAFSGQNFPDILVPLMQQHDVMINPERPLVIYESMAFELKHLEFDELQIELAETSLKVAGKRGTAELHFSMNANGQLLGHGVKQLVLSGLRPFDQSAVQLMCDTYQASKLLA